MFLGDDLLPYLMLAIGGALVVGNLLALIRPPAKVRDQAGRSEGDIEGGAVPRPPLARSLVMAAVGAVAAIWAIASLTS